MPHAFATFRRHLVEFHLLLGREKSRCLGMRLCDPIGYLFCRRPTDCIDVGSCLLDQRLDLRRLLGSKRESRLQTGKDMARHLGWLRRTKSRSQDMRTGEDTYEQTSDENQRRVKNDLPGERLCHP